MCASDSQPTADCSITQLTVLLHCPAAVASGNVVDFVMEYGTSLANASEQAGLGLCMTYVAQKDNDESTIEELVRIHTGRDE